MSPATKRPYTKPKIEQILLHSEESVLQACKQDSGVPGESKKNGNCMNPWICLTASAS